MNKRIKKKVEHRQMLLDRRYWHMPQDACEYHGWKKSRVVQKLYALELSINSYIRNYL